MSRNYVRTADFLDPAALVVRIETDEQAFTEGRRNDDLVNWFLAMLLCGLGRSFGSILGRYHEMFARLTPYQKADLTTWDVDPVWKLQVLFEHYGHLSQPVAIQNLWIPVEYRTDPPIHDGQISLPIGGN